MAFASSTNNYTKQCLRWFSRSVQIRLLIGASLTLVMGNVAVGSDRPSPQLLVYSSVEHGRAEKILEAFRKASGVEAQIVRTFRSGHDAVRRLYADRNAAFVDVPDVWFGANVESHELARRRGLLQVYQSRALLPKEFKDPEGYWTAIYLDPLVFGVDVSTHEKLRISAPESWEDLLGPDLINQITLPSPESKTMQLIVRSLGFLLGEEHATQYLIRLDRNIISYGRDKVDWFGGRGSERSLVTIDLASTLLERLDAGRIRALIPQEGAGFDTGAVSIIRGAPRIAAARKLVDWLCGIEGQNALGSVAAPLLPLEAAKRPRNSPQGAPRPVLVSPSLLPTQQVADRISRTVAARAGRWQ
jgi:iron(III) transport system substrate-binding protein